MLQKISNPKNSLLSSKSAKSDFWRIMWSSDWSNDAENTALHHKLHFKIY